MRQSESRDRVNRRATFPALFDLAAWAGLLGFSVAMLVWSVADARATALIWAVMLYIAANGVNYRLNKMSAPNVSQPNIREMKDGDD